MSIILINGHEAEAVSSAPARVAVAKDEVAVAEDESIPLYKRRAYRPNCHKNVQVAALTSTDWVCVPGTSVPLWPKLAS